MTALATQPGALGIFLPVIPESACIPVPSEITLLGAGFAVRAGVMPFWIAVAAATAGNLSGSLIAYVLGRFATGRLQVAWAQRGLNRCDDVFTRHGARAVFLARLTPLARAVFLARLTPLARTFVSLPAGHARVALPDSWS